MLESAQLCSGLRGLDRVVWLAEFMKNISQTVKVRRAKCHQSLARMHVNVLLREIVPMSVFAQIESTRRQQLASRDGCKEGCHAKAVEFKLNCVSISFVRGYCILSAPHEIVSSAIANRLLVAPYSM